MKKNFIIYPETQIPADNVEIVDAPLKDKLKSFITGYLEDYGELPSAERLQSLFYISSDDARMALLVYGN